jgi:putative transposase
MSKPQPDVKKVAIFQLVDDHSRLAMASLVAAGETSEAAVAIVTLAIERHGVPQKLLSDNGAALNPTRRGQRGALVEFLIALGTEPITGKPYKPITQGKNERFHQTLHKYLHRQPPAETIAVLQAQIDNFDRYYNTERVHQSLPSGMTPQEAWESTPKAPTPARPTLGAPTSSNQKSTSRIVGREGTMTVLGTHFRMGKDYIGSTVHILYDEAHILFFDALGVEIISHARPPKGTSYVGSPGKAASIMADPVAAVWKRKRNPVKTDPHRSQQHQAENNCLHALETSTVHKDLRHQPSTKS